MELTKEQKVLKTIIHKAWEDGAFKEILIADPVSAIENLIGERINLPNDKIIVVSDQTDSSVIYINIPAQPNMELNNEQLDAISGGDDSGVIIIDPSQSLTGLIS